MIDKTEEKNPYGENHPASEGTGEESIREQVAEDLGQQNQMGTGEELHDTREKQSRDASGGMGRDETPRDSDAPSGVWHHEQDVPQNSELSDQVPS